MKKIAVFVPTAWLLGVVLTLAQALPQASPASQGMSAERLRQLAATMKAAAETNDWTFTGTIRDGEMRGNVATASGSFPFTGSKP